MNFKEKIILLETVEFDNLVGQQGCRANLMAFNVVATWGALDRLPDLSLELSPISETFGQIFFENILMMSWIGRQQQPLLRRNISWLPKERHRCQLKALPCPPYARQRAGWWGVCFGYIIDTVWKLLLHFQLWPSFQHWAEVSWFLITWITDCPYMIAMNWWLW